MSDENSEAASRNPGAIGAYSFIGPLIASRAEILSTFLLDGALVTLAALARWGFLWILHALGDASGGPIRVLEFILDYGLLGTALIITGFDLAKRIKMAYTEFRQ